MSGSTCSSCPPFGKARSSRSSSPSHRAFYKPHPSKSHPRRFWSRHSTTPDLPPHTHSRSPGGTDTKRAAVTPGTGQQPERPPRPTGSLDATHYAPCSSLAEGHGVLDRHAKFCPEPGDRDVKRLQRDDLNSLRRDPGPIKNFADCPKPV